MIRFPSTATLLLSALLLLGLAAPQGSEVPRAASDLLATVDEIAAKVEEIRGLSFKEQVQRAVKSRPEIEAALKAKILEEYTPEEIVRQTRALVRWGLLDRGTDLMRLYLDLLTEQVAGFYDPKKKTFFLADWISPEMQAPIIAHELTHALQDQSFGLERRIGRDRENDDRSLARMALVEGEGIAVMFDFLLRPMGMRFADLPELNALLERELGTAGAAFRELGRAPRIVREELLFPYTAGAAFVQEALRRDSWRAVSRIYDDLPRSTEQILHPERYFDERDVPVELSLDPLSEWLGAAFTKNVLGELGFRILFEERFDEETAARLAAGWDGDRFCAWELEGRVVLASVSVWDSLADALEFFGGYQQLLSRKYPALERIEGTPNRARFTIDPKGEELAVLIRQGNLVLLFEGLSPKRWAEMKASPPSRFFRVAR